MSSIVLLCLAAREEMGAGRRGLAWPTAWRSCRRLAVRRGAHKEGDIAAGGRDDIIRDASRTAARGAIVARRIMMSGAPPLQPL